MELFDKIYNKSFYTLLKSNWYKKQVVKNPRRALNIKWWTNYRKPFPFKNPQTLDEKIGWLQVNTDTSLWSRLADKYEVRKYVEEKGLAEILIPTYGVWSNIDTIDFELLPNEFVIKCTHDCGSTIVVKDKHKIDVDQIKIKLSKFYHKRGGWKTFEPHYMEINPRIVAERLLQVDPVTGSIIDYKFWCCNGEPLFCLLCYNRKQDGHVTVDCYDLHPWRECRYRLSEMMQRQNFINIPVPNNLDQMIEIAKTLSKGMPAVRVDLYNIKGQIYFGEMTFTGAAGNHYYFTKETQLEMGKKIRLPNNN